MVGADLRNLVNEAALLAARHELKAVGHEEFAEALEKVLLGAEQHILISPEERERTAYYESGRALLGMLQPGADPIRNVSIIPRGQALGVTFQSPEKDRSGFDDADLQGRLTGLLGGRAAEELVYRAITTSAESDLEKATVIAIARQMVGRWGMSEEIRLVTVLPPEMPGRTPSSARARSPSRRASSWTPRSDGSPTNATSAHSPILDEHRDQLGVLAYGLLEDGTLYEPDAYAAAGIPHVRTTDASIAATA